MANSEEMVNKRETRQVEVNQNSPEILTNPIYTPAFLREQIGKLMRVEFLIGTNNLLLFLLQERMVVCLIIDTLIINCIKI